MFLRGFLYSFSPSEQESDKRRDTEEICGLCSSCKISFPVLTFMSLILKQLRQLKYWECRFWAVSEVLSKYLIMIWILNRIWTNFTGKWVKPLFLRLLFSGGNLSWKFGDLVHSLIDFSVIRRDKSEFYHSWSIDLSPRVFSVFAASECGSIKNMA